MKIVFGIDPGLKGGISVFYNRHIQYAMPMPVDSEGEIDVRRLFTEIRKIRDCIRYEFAGDSNREYVAYIEKVGAMPGQGVVSMFTFGNGYGVVKSAFKLHMETHLVTPQTWKKIVLKDYDWKQKVEKLVIPKNATKEEIKNLKKEYARRKAEAKRNSKNVSIQYVIDNYPEVDLIQKGKVPKDGIADACCIAVYGAYQENIF